MERKLFTVDEANRALPRVARLVRALQDRLQWLGAHRQPISYLVAEFNIVNESPVDGDYFKALLRVRRHMKEIHDVGAQMKDINTGLVDFPALLHGKEVLLCWKLGEDEIRFWHDPESGFAGRQPLPAAEGGSTSEGEGN
jgi:hypothetical protein